MTMIIASHWQSWRLDDKKFKFLELMKFVPNLKPEERGSFPTFLGSQAFHNTNNSCSSPVVKQQTLYHKGWDFI